MLQIFDKEEVEYAGLEMQICPFWFVQGFEYAGFIYLRKCKLI
jgi:hypothetical protein